MQGAFVSPGLNVFFGLAGGGACLIGQKSDERVQNRFGLVDSGEMGFYNFNGGNFLALNQLGEVSCAHIAEF